MIQIRPSDAIYTAHGGWFTARWHFSFDRYHDPDNMGFGDLRVFNDDRLIPGAVWPMHPHRDIEGITYVAEGTFEHADSLGNGGVLRPGAVQRATLGRGMQHSERNHSPSEPMRFIQMWIMPAQLGLEPGVEQRQFEPEQLRGGLRPLLVPAAGYGAPGSAAADDAVTVHQDAVVYGGIVDGGAAAEVDLRDGFGGYAFVVQGAAEIGADGTVGGTIDEGGAAKVSGVSRVRFRALDEGAEILLVETRLR